MHFLFTKSVKTCVERYLHVSHIYSVLKDVHPIFSTFKLVKLVFKDISFKSHLFCCEGCAPYLFNVQICWKLAFERYLHLSCIYSVLNDVHHIFSMFKSVKTYVEWYFHLNFIYSEWRMCTLFNIQVGGNLLWKIFSFKSHLFGGEGCAPYQFNLQVGGNLCWKIFAVFLLMEIHSKSYLWIIF